MIMTDHQAMKKAIKEAQKGVGGVEPNPPVGCVILDKNSQFLSSGYHKKWGGSHAEAEALKKIKDKKKLKSAKVFLTLEPCHHYGKTPPCSYALARASVASLTYGALDPSVRGAGLRFLKNQGVKVCFFKDLQAELKALIKPFVFSFVHKKAFVSLKMATSLNGLISPPFASEKGLVAKGQAVPLKRQWISQAAARRHSHFLRASHQAVLVGVSTLLKDNPRLNIRHPSFKGQKNQVIILDPGGKSLSFLPSSRLLKAHKPCDILIVSSLSKQKITGLAGGLLKSGLKVKTLAEKNRCFDLSSLLKFCYREEGIKSVLVEGGGFTWSEFLNQNQVQKLYLYMAPLLISPEEGFYWSRFFKPKAKKCRLKITQLQKVGGDFLMEGDF